MSHSMRAIAAACLFMAGCSEPEAATATPAAEADPVETSATVFAPAATLAAPAAELSATDPARAAIQAALEAAVARSLGVPAKVDVEIMRAETQGELQWAYVSGPALAPDGTEIDLSKTTMARPAKDGMMDGTNVVALMKRSGGVWSVATMAIGPTDVPAVGWPRQYKVSAALVGQEEAEGEE